MAYFRGQEIGDAVISHHLYEHNIHVKLQNHVGNLAAIIIKVLSAEAEPFTFDNFLTKIGANIFEPSPVVSIDIASRYNIIGVYQAETSPNIQILYYENGIVMSDNDTCLSTDFGDLVKQIF